MLLFIVLKHRNTFSLLVFRVFFRESLVFVSCYFIPWAVSCKIVCCYFILWVGGCSRVVGKGGQKLGCWAGRQGTRGDAGT